MLSLVSSVSHAENWDCNSSLKDTVLLAGRMENFMDQLSVSRHVPKIGKAVVAQSVAMLTKLQKPLTCGSI